MSKRNAPGYDPTATKAWTITIKKGHTIQEELVHENEKHEVYGFEVLYITHLSVGKLSPEVAKKNERVVVEF